MTHDDAHYDTIRTALHRTLKGPADADHYRVRVGRYGDRWYCDGLPADKIAGTTDDAWPSVTTVKKASGSDWSFVALKRVNEALRAKPKILDGLDYDERADKLRSINSLGLKRAGERGTNVHLMFEDGLRGKPVTALVSQPGAEYAPAIQAFFDTYQPELVAAELVCINRTLNGMGYGGTCDAVIRINGKTYVVDWKSRGEDSNHGAYPEEGAQIAAYEGAEYIIVEGPDGPERRPFPKVDGGLIVSVKPDGCRVYPVDLELARAHWTSLHAWWVARRSEREAIGKPWAPKKAGACASADPTTSDDTGSAGSTSTDGSTSTTSLDSGVAGGATVSSLAVRKTYLIGKIATADDATRAALKERWPQAIPSLKRSGHTHADLDWIERTLEEICPADTSSTESRSTSTISSGTGTSTASTARTSSTSEAIRTLTQTNLKSRPDEGADVAPEDVEGIKAALGRLEPYERAWVAAVGKESAAAGYSVNFGHGPTTRRWSLARAIIKCARLSGGSSDDELVRALLAVVLDTEAAKFPTVPLGQSFAALTISEAARLADLADSVNTPDVDIAFGLEGVILTGPAVERARAA